MKANRGLRAEPPELGDLYIYIFFFFSKTRFRHILKWFKFLLENMFLNYYKVCVASVALKSALALGRPSRLLLPTENGKQSKEVIFQWKITWLVHVFCIGCTAVKKIEDNEVYQALIRTMHSVIKRFLYFSKKKKVNVHDAFYGKILSLPPLIILQKFYLKFVVNFAYTLVTQAGSRLSAPLPQKRS